MKRFAILMAVSAVLALSLVIPSSAGSAKLRPSSNDVFSLYQGYYENNLIWFTGFETSDLKLASSALFVDFIHAYDLFRNRAYHYPQFAPKLSSALIPNPANGLTAARPMYVVLNFQQGPVLSTRPGNSDYSGLWQIFFVQWLPGVTPRCIGNDAAPGTDPMGLPPANQATITPTNIVFSCPVIAVGTLDLPANPPVQGSYRIPQALDFPRLGSPHTVRLPVFMAWYDDPITKATWTATELVITDTSDPALARMLGANLAPGLLNLPAAGTQTFWTFLGPQPPGQRPLMSAGPSTSAAVNDTRTLNQYLDYSPVIVYTELNRNIPAYATVRSVNLLKMLLANGGLTVADDDRRILAHASFIFKGRL